MLSSDSRAGRAREGQNSLCRDQTGPSPTQDSSHADGGALSFRSVLPANQRAQCHEKVITPRALPLQGSKDIQTQRDKQYVMSQG